jgi:hypothetical protein
VLRKTAPYWRRSFRALTQASNECHFALATPPMAIWGLLRPGFSEIEVGTHMFTGKFDLNSHRGGVAKTKSTLTAVPVACPLVGQVFAGRRGKTRSKTAGRRKKQNKTKARRRCPRTNLRGQARGSGNIIPPGGGLHLEDLGCGAPLLRATGTPRSPCVLKHGT